MLGARKFGTLLSTQWEQCFFESLLCRIGHFGYMPPGSYRIGCNSQLLSLDSPTPGLHAPALETNVDLAGFFYLVAPISFETLLSIPLQHYPVKIIDEVEANISGFLEGSSFLSLLGWRCISEQEWEAVVFRRLANSDDSIHEDQFRKFSEQRRADAKNGGPQSSLEWTSSLGYAMDVTEWGSDAEADVDSGNWHRWPGVILRGWQVDYGTDPRSRFSSRLTHNSILFRPVIELSTVKTMSSCLFKSYLLSRRQMHMTIKPGIHIDKFGAILSNL